MNNYYFTFGTGQVFTGGWVRIIANSLKDAQRKFKERYKDKAYENGLLRYCFAYMESEFYNTDMLSEGNLGHYQWDTIS